MDACGLKLLVGATIPILRRTPVDGYRPLRTVLGCLRSRRPQVRILPGAPKFPQFKPLTHHGNKLRAIPVPSRSACSPCSSGPGVT